MKHAFIAMYLFIAIGVQAQNVGIGNSSPNVNAKLDITSSDKGVLIPRMDSTHRKAISNTIGLLVYDSTTNSFWYNNGVAWQNMATAASGWSLTGNGGTDPAVNFLGTTDNTPLVFRINNQPAGQINDYCVSLGTGAYMGVPKNGVPITAIGLTALQNNFKNPSTSSGGFANTAVGANSLQQNTIGSNNTALGEAALMSSTTGGNNIAAGVSALKQNTTGSWNSAFGVSAMLYSSTGTNNTGIGAWALGGNKTGNGNTGIGVNALASNYADYNAALGYNALSYNTTGTDNAAHGAYALNFNTTGSNNTAMGNYALESNQTGGSNTAIGVSALRNNINDPGIYTSGYFNTAVGASTLYSNTTGQNNTAVGIASQYYNTTGQGNASVGQNSMYRNISGINNAALGSAALLQNQTGNYNTAVGSAAGGYNVSGNYNTAVGSNAGANGDATGNTSVGYKALYSNLNGDNNTALGYNADFAAGGGFTNATAIGANAKVDASNKIRLGDANVTIVESNGVFNTVSDGRFKYNIRENVKGLDFILKLRPVTYQFDTKKQEDFIQGNLSTEQLNSPVIPANFNESNSIKRTGFIAQEVATAAQKTGYDFDGVKIPVTDKQYYSLSYASFVVPLVKAMQEQQLVIEDLKKQNELLQQQNQLILKRLDALEKK
ncbi:MAG: tail fiber domain-containing protein [Bacteroidota bacterium]